MEIDWEPRAKTNNVDVDLIFQTLDWYCVDEIEPSDSPDAIEFPRFTVYVFGVSLDDIPISLRLIDFYPFFFIEVPQSFDESCTHSLKAAFNKIGLKPKSIEYLERKRYYGFENNRMRKFMKLTFYTSKSMSFVRKYIENNSIEIFGEYQRFDLYESNSISYEEALKNADSLNDLRLNIKLHSQHSKDTNVMSGIEHLKIT